MTVPGWWSERRFGLFVHATVATVPAWSPIGEYAEWYRSHLGEDVADVLLHPHTMVEVLAHHRDRWGHVERYDDFVDLLSFDRFDAEEWARVARDAGAGYAILVTKHHDGWAWWDAPRTERRLDQRGPNRNVVGEFAAACERNDLAFGTYYSLLDWGDERYPDAAYVDMAHDQVVDLVGRYGSAFLWGDGHWGHGADTWRTEELLERVRAISPDLLVNDRWWAARPPHGAPPIVRTFEYDAPDDITDGPWELTRGIGHSFGHNRAEQHVDHLTALEIVELFTEVVAKGGNLLLNVGPASDGTIPALQADPLTGAGAWIRRHHDLLAACDTWTDWGSTETRHLLESDVDGVQQVIAIDITGSGRFSAFGSSEVEIHGVERVGSADAHPVAFAQHPGHLNVEVDQDRDSGDRVTEDDVVDGVEVAVYRITHSSIDAPAALFSTSPPAPTPLAQLLDGARVGSIVQLGEGAYEGPAVVPAGVTLRGLGADRTVIVPAVNSADRNPVITVGDDAHVEHLRVAGTATRSDWSAPVVVSVPGEAAGLLGCTVDGPIRVDADDVLVRAVRAKSLEAHGTDRLHVSRCEFTGNRWDVGLHLRGGSGHHIESSSFADHLCAIRVSDTTGTKVRGNSMAGRWWGVHAERTDGAHVHGNRIRSTMRAVDIDGGSHAAVDGNSVAGGDSGCIVEAGAADCEVYGNHWDRCRIGLLAWGAVNLHHQDNVASDLRDSDAAYVTGP